MSSMKTDTHKHDEAAEYWCVVGSDFNCDTVDEAVLAYLKSWRTAAELKTVTVCRWRYEGASMISLRGSATVNVKDWLRKHGLSDQVRSETVTKYQLPMEVELESEEAESSDGH